MAKQHRPADPKDGPHGPHGPHGPAGDVAGAAPPPPPPPPPPPLAQPAAGPNAPTPGDWGELWKAAGPHGPRLYAFTRAVVESLTGRPPPGRAPHDAPHLDAYLVRGAAEYLKLLGG